ncbi:Os06g0331000 [Oryza sativa Japonica Group]|uniref:Os06g0331000 protein n=1 Tax=Oryza sativa subsp. japonica TaxID=39947 RepID=A0A0P0WW11_ORYSJ|nr:Os06g0331000 [Oryza sativa Japonica Group]
MTMTSPSSTSPTPSVTWTTCSGSGKSRCYTVATASPHPSSSASSCSVATHRPTTSAHGDEKGVRGHPRDPSTPIRYVVIYISGSHALCTSPTATSPSTPSACFLSTRTAEGWRGSSHSCTIGVSRWPASVRAM